MHEINMTDFLQCYKESQILKHYHESHFEELCEVWIAVCYGLNLFFDEDYLLSFELIDKLLAGKALDK